MWQYLGEHYNLFLGLAAGLIWLVVLFWFLYSSRLLKDWSDLWRERRKRRVW
jgi:hypothetical protein